MPSLACRSLHSSRQAARPRARLWCLPADHARGFLFADRERSRHRSLWTLRRRPRASRASCKRSRHRVKSRVGHHACYPVTENDFPGLTKHARLSMCPSVFVVENALAQPDDLAHAEIAAQVGLDLPRGFEPGLRLQLSRHSSVTNTVPSPSTCSAPPLVDDGPGTARGPRSREPCAPRGHPGPMVK